MNCPFCGAKVTNEPLKSWIYGVYIASRYLCDNCGEKFNEYTSEGRKSFTVPKGEF